ncbi:hypothetical protein ES703_35956 [subsurface metagenome]
MSPWIAWAMVSLITTCIGHGSQQRAVEPKLNPQAAQAQEIVQVAEVVGYAEKLRNLRQELNLKDGEYISVGMFRVAPPDQSGKYQDVEYPQSRSTYLSQAVFQKQIHLLAQSEIVKVFDAEFMKVLMDKLNLAQKGVVIGNNNMKLRLGDYFWKTVITDLEFINRKGIVLRWVASTLTSQVERVRIKVYMGIVDDTGVFVDGMDMSVEVKRTKGDLTLLSFWKTDKLSGIEMGGAWSQGLDQALESLMRRMTYELLRDGISKGLLKPVVW